MIDIRNVSPDRVMAAFMARIKVARKGVMEQRTDQIRKDVTEARTSCPGVELKLNDARMLDDLEFLLSRVDELVKQAEDGCEADHKVYARGRADAIADYSDLIPQLTNAMGVLNAAGIKDVGGEVASRLARRITNLVDQRTSKHNAMKLAVSNHDHAKKRLLAAENAIDEAHRALSAADIEKVFPLKRRIEILAKQELSKHNALVGANIVRYSVNRDLTAATEIIAEVHKALDEADVPKHEGVTLGERLKPVIDEWSGSNAFRLAMPRVDFGTASGVRR